MRPQVKKWALYKDCLVAAAKLMAECQRCATPWHWLRCASTEKRRLWTWSRGQPAKRVGLLLAHGFARRDLAAPDIS